MTAAGLETMPDDGHRYELIDGTLIVTPSPGVPHQRAVGNLYVAHARTEAGGTFATTLPFNLSLDPAYLVR